MAALGSFSALLFVALLYWVIAPFFFLIALRVLLWLGRALGLPDALAAFGAEVSRAYRAEAKSLDRQFGGTGSGG